MDTLHPYYIIHLNKYTIHLHMKHVQDINLQLDGQLSRVIY